MNAALLPSRLLSATADGVASHPVLLILLFDTSTSVTEGADLDQRRYAEAATVIERCRPDLVAVNTFDQSAPPVPADAVGPALDALRIVAEGSSQLRPALLRAERLARTYPQHRTVLAVFSDFQLLDTWPAGVLARLAKFPGEVQTFTLGGER